MQDVIEIRPLEADDWSAAWRILEPVFRAGETYAFSPGITEAEAYGVWVAQPAATFVAVATGGGVVGTYYLKPNQPALGAHVCNCGYIVAEAARGRGIASALCAHSQREAVARGFRAMQYNLVVATNTGAVRLWKRHGFEIVGTLPQAFRHPQLGFVDAFVMYKRLAPGPQPAAPHAAGTTDDPSMNLEPLDRMLADLCETQFAQIGWTKPEGYFRACRARQQAGELVAFVAHAPGRYLGHALLVWRPRYAPFRAAGIPEIQDLNVLPRYRDQGIGTALITACEERAAQRSGTIGIGVGLHPGYNQAQRRYSKLGYVLDGRGVHYRLQPVEMGRRYPFDDDLALYLTKALTDHAP